MERPVLTQPRVQWCVHIGLDVPNWYGTKMSPCNHYVTVAKAEDHIVYPTNLCRAFDDRIEDRLHICRRAADNPEHLRRRRLMLQSLAQFCVALLDLFEQSDIFDGDDSLISEGFEK